MFKKDFIISSFFVVLIICIVSILCIYLINPSFSLDNELTNRGKKLVPLTTIVLTLDKKVALIELLHQYNCQSPLDMEITNKIISILGDKK